MQYTVWPVFLARGRDAQTGVFQAIIHIAELACVQLAVCIPHTGIVKSLSNIITLPAYQNITDVPIVIEASASQVQIGETLIASPVGTGLNLADEVNAATFWLFGCLTQKLEGTQNIRIGERYPGFGRVCKFANASTFAGITDHMFLSVYTRNISGLRHIYHRLLLLSSQVYKH